MARTQVGPLARYGGRVGHQTILYSASSVATFVFAVAMLAVLTRYLTLSEYGSLALLNLFATFLTVAYNLGSLQGTLLAVFGEGDEGVEARMAMLVPASEVRRTLSTGLIVTVLTGAAGTVLVAAAASPVAHLLLGSEQGGAHLVVLAAATGALGSVWRFTSNIPRFERRPWVFATLMCTRPALVLVGSVVFVMAGQGIEGALIGNGLATLVASVIAMTLAAQSYEFAYDRRLARIIWNRGGFTIPFIALIWVVHNVDLYIVSLFASQPDVARYRVASRIGAGMSYFVSALLMALGPLTNSTLYAAVTRRQAEIDPRAALVRYFVVACLWITLGLAAFSDGLIRIAPAAYSDAAHLIPIVALGFAAFGVFTVVQRFGNFPDKRRRLVQLSGLAAVVFLAIGLVLVPLVGSIGAPVAQIAAFMAAGTGTVILQRRARAPMLFEPARLAKGVLLGIACLVVGQIDFGLARDADLAVDTSLLCLFPLGLIALGVTPLSELRPLARALLLRSAPRLSDLRVKLSAQPHRRAEAIALMVRERRAPAEAAAAMQTSLDDVLSEATRGLRGMTGVDEPTPLDAEIGTYLFAPQAPAERDRLARELWTTGADPVEVDQMEVVLERLRHLPPSHWPRPTEAAISSRREPARPW